MTFWVLEQYLGSWLVTRDQCSCESKCIINITPAVCPSTAFILLMFQFFIIICDATPFLSLLKEHLLFVVYILFVIKSTSIFLFFYINLTQPGKLEFIFNLIITVLIINLDHGFVFILLNMALLFHNQICFFISTINRRVLHNQTSCCTQ